VNMSHVDHSMGSGHLARIVRIQPCDLCALEAGLRTAVPATAACLDRPFGALAAEPRRIKGVQLLMDHPLAQNEAK